MTGTFHAVHFSAFIRSSACLRSKHPRQNTRRPGTGLNGTTARFPQPLQITSVSIRAGPPLSTYLRALHTLQVTGCLCCFEFKNACSPAVTINVSPQSTHSNFLSDNSTLPSFRIETWIDLRMSSEQPGARTHRPGLG
jgi:hypothetical protein